MSVPVQAASTQHTAVSQTTVYPGEHTDSSTVTVNRCHNYNRTDVNIWRSDHLEIYWDRYHITERTATVNTLNNLAFRKTDKVIQLIDL